METSTKILMKSKVNIDDFLIVIYWVKSFFSFENKNFNYQNLLDQAETYKMNNTSLDTSIHQIDELMIDAYKIYDKLKKTEDQFNKVLDVVNFPFFNKEVIIAETTKFIAVYEDLIENYRYEDPEIRGIQKGFLGEKMSKFIIKEEYEKAGEIKKFMLENKMCVINELSVIEKESYKENMSKFIAEEEYEKAAKMRDNINEL